EVRAGVTDVDLVIGPDRRAAIIAPCAELEVPQLLALLGDETEQRRVHVVEIEFALVQERRAELDLGPVDLPDDLGLAVIDLGSIQTQDTALARAGLGVDLAVSDIDTSAVDDGVGVDASVGEDVAPDLLAGADLEGVDAAVAAAANQQPLPLDDCDHGTRLVAVLYAVAGRRPPDDGAGLLVEGDEAVAAASIFTPGRIVDANDDEVFIDDRAGEASAVAADAAVLLHQGALPEDFSVLVEAGEQALDAVAVDVAGVGIADQIGPGDTGQDDGSVPDVEA